MTEEEIEWLKIKYAREKKVRESMEKRYQSANHSKKNLDMLLYIIPLSFLLLIINECWVVVPFLWIYYFIKCYRNNTEAKKNNPYKYDPSKIEWTKSMEEGFKRINNIKDDNNEKEGRK